MKLFRSVAPVVVVCCLLTGVAIAQDTVVIPNTTNTCINSTYKLYIPNQTAPTFIGIVKYLTNVTASCMLTASNSAFCNANLSSAVASVTGMQITQSPSCQWTCGGCGTISTGPSDGLPVELMAFDIEDGDSGQ